MAKLNAAPRASLGEFASIRTRRDVVLGLRTLISGRFGPRDVRLLLIDAREVVRKALNNKFPDPGGCLEQFLDAADFVAHTNRDRGHVEQRIRSNVEFILARFEQTGQLPIGHKTKEVLSEDAVIIAVMVLARDFIPLLDASAEIARNDFFLRIAPQVGLCLMATMQHSVIELTKHKTPAGKESNGSAHLQIGVRNGCYRLLCTVQDSRLSRVVEDRHGLIVKLIFPVIISTAPDIDFVAQSEEQIEADQLIESPPPLIEFFRALDCQLHAWRVN